MADNINDMTKATPFIGAGVGAEGKRDAIAPKPSARTADKQADRERNDRERNSDDESRRKEAEAAENEAVAKRQHLDELRSKAEDSKLSDEEREIRKAEREADDAAARAADLRRNVGSGEHPSLVGDVPGHPIAASAPDMDLGDHRAQRFGNIPANPKPAKGEHTDPERMTSRMLLRTPDSSAPQEAWVHPEMIGDYARAGWELDAAAPMPMARDRDDYRRTETKMPL